jgi:hypothetical protein
MVPGDDEGVSLEDRPYVKERCEGRFVQHPVRAGLAGEDAVEHARGLGDHGPSDSRDDGKPCRTNPMYR